MDASGNSPSITGLSLQVTDACNLACSYCYFYRKEPISISAEVIERSLALLKGNSSDSSPWHINLFGGEPTLFPDIIESICSDATELAARSKRSVSFSMTTNGTRFDERILDLCKRYHISTMLSLDGNKAAHDTYRTFHSGLGSFDQIMERLPILRRAPDFKVRMTVSIKTLPHLADSIDLFVSKGIDRITTSVVAEDDWTEEAFAEFERQWLRVAAIFLRTAMAGNAVAINGLFDDPTRGSEQECRSSREFGCGAATKFVFVDAKGDIYPCHRFPGYFGKSSKVQIGNVFSGLDESRRQVYVAANRSSAKQGCGSFISSSRSTGRCPECAIQGACGGACMAINQYTTGDPTRPSHVLGRVRQIMLMVTEAVANYQVKHVMTAHREG